MKKDKNITIKKSLIFLFVCVSSALLSLVFCNVYLIMVTTLDSKLLYYIVMEAVAVILLSTLVFFCFVVLKQSVINPLTILKEGIQKHKKGFGTHRFNLSNTNEIGEIACAFNEIMCDLENSNKKLKTQSIELGILNSISKSITSTLDIDELSKLIVNEITGILGCPACILSLISTSSSNLHTAAYSGSYFEASDNINQFEDKVFCQAFLMKSIESYQICTASEIRSLLCDYGLNELVMPIQEFLFMPIKVKSKDIGVLSIGFSSEIKENDINLISSIATSVAVAIDNALLYETSKKYFFNTIDALIAAVEAKDKYTEGHSQRVSQYATSVAKMLNLPKEQIEEIKIAGILHDIGKIGISDNILLKPEKLTSDEYEVIKQHPLISNKILFPVGFSDRTLKAIAFHHERYDGKGYPYGLSGNEISIEAQIIAVADAYDAMTSNRSYRCALGSDIALKELVSNKSTQFNPQLVDCMVEIMMNTQRAS